MLRKICRKNDKYTTIEFKNQVRIERVPEINQGNICTQEIMIISTY